MTDDEILNLKLEHRTLTDALHNAVTRADNAEARVLELDKGIGVLRDALKSCIARAGMPNPSDGCRLIITTATRALTDTAKLEVE